MRSVFRAFIVVLSAVAYVAAWEATKKQAARQTLTTTLVACTAPMPCVLRYYYVKNAHLVDFPLSIQRVCRTELWLFGPTIQLPFESEWDEAENPGATAALDL